MSQKPTTKEKPDKKPPAEKPQGMAKLEHMTRGELIGLLERIPRADLLRLLEDC